MFLVSETIADPSLPFRAPSMLGETLVELVLSVCGHYQLPIFTERFPNLKCLGLVCFSQSRGCRITPRGAAVAEFLAVHAPEAQLRINFPNKTFLDRRVCCLPMEMSLKAGPFTSEAEMKEPEPERHDIDRNFIEPLTVTATSLKGRVEAAQLLSKQDVAFMLGITALTLHYSTKERREKLFYRLSALVDRVITHGKGFLQLQSISVHASHSTLAGVLVNVRNRENINFVTVASLLQRLGEATNGTLKRLDRIVPAVAMEARVLASSLSDSKSITYLGLYTNTMDLAGNHDHVAVAKTYFEDVATVLKKLEEIDFFPSTEFGCREDASPVIVVKKLDGFVHASRV
jgi:hypothetical protein